MRQEGRHVAAGAYLSHLAHSGRKSSTIGQRAALIACTARAGKAPATADVLMQMVALCPDNMIDRRDRALLAQGFADAFRWSELYALQVDDLVEGTRADPAVED